MHGKPEDWTHVAQIILQWWTDVNTTINTSSAELNPSSTLRNFNHLLTHYFKKFVTVYFYLAGGLAHRKTLDLKGQDFPSGFTPLYDSQHSFQSVIYPFFDFRVSLS